MYVIKMENDKNLITTIKSTIYRGELNANRILFLLPNEWEEHLMADYGVRLDYITPDGIGHSEMLVAEPDSYKEYLQFYVPVCCPITDQVGEVELWLSILDRDGTVTIKTGSNYLFVVERKVISDYYPAEKRELLDTLATDVETLKRTKADNLVYDLEAKSLQLSAEGEPIGDKIITSCSGTTSTDTVILFGGRGCSKIGPKKQKTETAKNSRLGLLFVVKWMCEKQITAKILWHMRAECATKN